MGAFLKDYFPDKLKESLPGIFGLSAITMGVTLIIRLESLSAVILAVIIGTVIGVLLLQVLLNVMTIFSFPAFLQSLVQGVIVIVAVLYDYLRKKKI